MRTITANEHPLEILIGKYPDASIKRIMIVDHSDDVNLTLKIVLSESDKRLRVHSFNDPLIALREFKPNFYHLVIIDILLPKMNGFELYDKLRKLDSKVKICFLTAGGDIPDEIRKQVFAADISEGTREEDEKICFIKIPIANEDLVKELKNLLD